MNSRSNLDDPAALLRRCLIVLAVLGIAGTGVELAMIRHWGTVLQTIPWVVLVALTITTLALVRARSATAVVGVRIVAITTVAASLFGMIEHVKANFDAGPLDAVYGPRWDAMSMSSKWWDAFVKRVGPSPTLAPGVLAQIGLCLLFATMQHPVLRSTVMLRRRGRSEPLRNEHVNVDA